MTARHGSLRLAASYPWHWGDFGDWRLAWAGRLEPATLTSNILKGVSISTSDRLISRLTQRTGNFAFLAETRDVVVAACDRVRGYPVFYASDRGRLVFSNSARKLKESLSLNTPDPTSLLDALMAGYVSGNATLFRDLRQVLPGEVLVLDKTTGELHTARYYEFSPVHTEDSEEQLIERLAAATETTFKRVAEDAGGRVILVPLSGGLDSRLVLSMLKQHGYPHLQAFSYGPPENEEAERASWVAERLNVPWKFFPSTQASARRLFGAPERKQYWREADGLSSVPNMQEYQVLSEIREQGLLESDVVMVNGQSGDFISGGHLPSDLVGPESEGDIFGAVLKKHFSLWTMLLTPENVQSLRERFTANLETAKNHGVEEPAHLYEYWEWQERQSKFVVNQQRVYDFFNIDWLLPLWDREYCEFWREVPVSLKLGQALYERYLDRWDYRGLFTDPRLRVPMIGWPGLTRAVRPIARLAGLLAGPAAKESLYRYAKYVGYYRHQLGMYPFSYFRKRAPFFRNGVSLFVETWLRELFPEWMEETFPIQVK